MCFLYYVSRVMHPEITTSSVLGLVCLNKLTQRRHSSHACFPVLDAKTNYTLLSSFILLHHPVIILRNVTMFQSITCPVCVGNVLWKCLCVLCPKFTQKYLVRGLPKISVVAFYFIL